MSNTIDLGNNHILRYTCWKPERDLNPQYDGIEDVEKFGAIIDHPHAQTGENCSGAITFETETSIKLDINPRWKVISWEPLTLDPSIACDCGDHGYIRNDKWESA
jgi:hypothetical protein